jgi:hypothetical protein
MKRFGMVLSVIVVLSFVSTAFRYYDRLEVFVTKKA